MLFLIPMTSSQIPRQMASKEKSARPEVHPRPGNQKETSLKNKTPKVSREGEILNRNPDPVRR
jgi:hypothetical protein